MSDKMSYDELLSYCHYLEELDTQKNSLHDDEQEIGIIQLPVHQEPMLRTLFDSTHSIIAALDCEYRLMSSNQAHMNIMKNIYGVDMKIGQYFFDYILDEADQKELKANFERGFSGESFSVTGYYGTKNRRCFELFHNPIYSKDRQIIGLAGVVQDITERKLVEEERDQLIIKLQQAIKNIKTLKGIIPICSSCHHIRDDKGFWNRVEAYVCKHTEAEFSHSVCPECAKKLYPEYSHLFI